MLNTRVELVRRIALQNPMRHLLPMLIAAWTGLSFAAAPEAGPESAPCREALAALRTQEATAAAERQAGGRTQQAQDPALPKRLEPWRRQAARACLGGSGDPPPPTHSVAPPVPGTTAAAVRPIVPSPPAAPALPLPVSQRADTVPTVTNCDQGGCWASDGSRLQRLGPNLVGPRGVCTTQGVLLHCP